MQFIFVADQIEHLKTYSISPRAHVLFSIYVSFMLHRFHISMINATQYLMGEVRFGRPINAALDHLNNSIK